MKSISILPLKKRSTASKEELLKALESAEQEITDLINSPALPAYKAINTKINEWSSQLETTPINLLDDEENDAFLRGHKFFIEMSLYFKSRQELLNYMTPSEKEQVKQLESGDKDSTHWVNPRGKKS